MKPVRGVILAAAVLLAGCAPAISGNADGITRLEAARVANPESAAVDRSLGIAYFKANRLADARAMLQKAVARNPTDGVAALYLGLTAEAQNDYPAARVAYESYEKNGRTRAVRK